MKDTLSNTEDIQQLHVYTECREEVRKLVSQQRDQETPVDQDRQVKSQVAGCVVEAQTLKLSVTQEVFRRP